MSSGTTSADGAPDAELIRDAYESSISWRVTRPLRAVGRRARALWSREGQRPSSASSQPTPEGYDLWLEPLYGERLRRIDAASAGGDPASFRLFRDLPVDLWALLLSREYTAYPNIRGLLPDMPEPALQELWNGAAGLRLAEQSATFYTRLRERYARHADLDLTAARVLDFGCGWGRLTRYLARDVAPGSLYGCDPVQAILDVCRAARVPAMLARSNFVPERLPFEGPFDLVFSFSVFTHISEAAHESCLRALHAALRPGGILALTIRPTQYLWFAELMRPLLATLGPEPARALEQPRYLFVPHAAEPSHFQWIGGEMTYGETVITLPYVRERWASLFELLEVDVLVGDPYQVMITLRRR